MGRFTPAGWADDAVFDVRVILQQEHLDVDLNAIPQFLLPAKGTCGLRDYEKVFSAEKTNGRLRAIDRACGALVVVRPDQYIAQVMPLGAHEDLAAFFTGFMLPGAAASATVSGRSSSGTLERSAAAMARLV